MACGSPTGTTVLDLHGNGWRFRRATGSGIELAQDDEPHLKASLQPSALALAGVAIDVPVREQGPTVRVSAPALTSDAGRTGSTRVGVLPRSLERRGIARYELDLRGRRGYKPLRGSGNGEGIGRLQGRPGATYKLRGRAFDVQGPAGPYAYGRTTVPFDDSRGERIPSFGGGKWSRAKGREAFLGGVSAATQRGATMRIRVRGSRVYLIARRGPKGGKALLRVGGRKRVVRFYRRKEIDRVVVGSLAANPKRTTTVELTALGSAARSTGVARCTWTRSEPCPSGRAVRGPARGARAPAPARVVRRSSLVALLAALLALAGGAPAARGAFSSADELRNFSKVNERFAHQHGLPDYRVELFQRSAEQEAALIGYLVADGERNPLGNLCAHKGDGCAGDVRLYDWERRGYGLSRPVLFTGRSGATISGRVWATRSGPAKRPGVVITTGSVQAPEELYWFAATTLAKRGYVVLTYDVQGQGSSDTFGEGADSNEGVPSQGGQPFYDGTEDALDFLLSTPASATPRARAAPPERRTRRSTSVAWPWGATPPSTRCTSAWTVNGSGSSATRSAPPRCRSSGRRDPRVDAIVAYDNLSAPRDALSLQSPCASAPGTRQRPKITKPALGFSNDYGLTPTPFTSEPSTRRPETPHFGPLPRRRTWTRPRSTSAAALTTSTPTSRTQRFGATLRGMDLVAWYTAAWLDKYLKDDLTADARLTTEPLAEETSEGRAWTRRATATSTRATSARG